MNLQSLAALSFAEVLWVDRSVHNLAYEIWHVLGRRPLIFVDCVSFVTMRHQKVDKVFGFDKHFVEQAFEIKDKRT